MLGWSSLGSCCFFIPVLDSMFDQVFDEHCVLELVLAVTGDLNKVIGLHTDTRLKHLYDSLLDLLVGVVDVDEDLLDRVTIQA